MSFLPEKDECTEFVLPDERGFVKRFIYAAALKKKKECCFAWAKGTAGSHGKDRNACETKRDQLGARRGVTVPLRESCDVPDLINSR